ncbi:hypothetical protein GCM10009555_065200 [Acrocarpospora macrocephala]|uniref:Uncharacterized protein n=1 Tax=Acrocarpospora macrocephala TaxID=150177 RepID=A0A5M3WZI7_9ACTN|nr:hypothetical protein [Acrocarpospora macrocephala]GES14917.1 hypothetical protein Amac_085140 [Acrocarpospora macrocephala]
MDLLRARPALTGQTAGAEMLVDGGKCSALRVVTVSLPDHVWKCDQISDGGINPMYRVGVV